MVLSNELLDTLQQLKEKAGLTNDEIGRLAGLSTATARRYISGEVKDAPRATIEKIILALGGNVADILGVKEPFDVEIYKSMLQEIRADHREEITRLIESHNKIVSNKDKWLTRLFCLCVAFAVLAIVAAIFAVIFKSMIPDISFVS